MTTQFNDASKAFWRYLVGMRVGVNEINNDDELRALMELDGISGTIMFPGDALNAAGGSSISENVGTGVVSSGATQWYNKTKSDNTFVNIANAVALSTALGAPSVFGGYAGTANTAARGDHQHPLQYGQQYPLLGTSSEWWSYPLGVSTGTSSVANVKCPVTAFPVPRRMTLNTLAFRPYPVGDAGSAKLALYATASNGLGTGAPIYTSPAQSVTAGNKIITGIGLTIEPGLYWLACGAYGFSTTRMNPRAVDSIAWASLFLPALAPAPSAPDVTPGIALANFNESTGAFPTLSAVVGDLVTNPGNTAMWYALQGVAA